MGDRKQQICQQCGEIGHNAIEHEFSARCCDCGCGRMMPLGHLRALFHPECARRRQREQQQRFVARSK